MSPFFLTILLAILLNSARCGRNKMKWKNYDYATNNNPDRKLLETFLGLTVKLHKWADTEATSFGPSSNDRPSLAILFSVTETMGTAYAIADVVRASQSPKTIDKIIGVTNFHHVGVGDEGEKMAIMKAQADYESKERNFWLPPYATTSPNGLVAVMCSEYGTRIVFEQPCRRKDKLKVKVSALQTATNLYSFEVEIGPTAAGQPIGETIVNYVNRWNTSLLLMDRGVDAYLNDSNQMVKDAKVRELINDYMKQYAVENKDGGAQGGDGLVREDLEWKVRKAWRVAEDLKNHEIPVVAICAAVCGTGPGGSDNGLSHTVVEIRIHRTGSYTVYRNEPTNMAGAIKIAAHLLLRQDVIAITSHIGKRYVLMRATTPEQLKDVAQRLRILFI